MDMLLQLSQVFALIALVSLLWLIVRAFKKHALWGFAVLLFSPVSAACFGIRYWREEREPFLAYLGSLVVAISLGLTVFTAWGGWELARTALRVHEGIQTRTLSERDAYNFMYANLEFIDKAGLDEQERRKLDVIRRFINEYEPGMTDAQRRQLHDEIAAILDAGGIDETRRRELDYLSRQLTRARLPETTGTPPTVTAAAPPAKTVRRSLSKRPSVIKTQYRTDYQVIPVSEARNYVGKSVKVTRRNSGEQDCKLIGATAHSLRFEQRGGGGTFVFEYHKRDIEELKLLARVDS